MLGQPSLVTCEHRGDAQREALLAEQRVASIAVTIGPDCTLLGEMYDILSLLVRRPRDVLLAHLEWHAD